MPKIIKPIEKRNGIVSACDHAILLMLDCYGNTPRFYCECGHGLMYVSRNPFFIDGFEIEYYNYCPKCGNKIDWNNVSRKEPELRHVSNFNKALTAIEEVDLYGD